MKNLHCRTIQSSKKNNNIDQSISDSKYSEYENKTGCLPNPGLIGS